jgi:hypothetical protein
VLQELATLIALGIQLLIIVVSIFMIRYSSYGSRNYRTPGKRTYLDPLAAEYRELQELRERVNKAEAAAAQRLKSRGERSRRPKSAKARSRGKLGTD